MEFETSAICLQVQKADSPKHMGMFRIANFLLFDSPSHVCEISKNVSKEQKKTLWNETVPVAVSWPEYLSRVPAVLLCHSINIGVKA